MTTGSGDERRRVRLYKHIPHPHIELRRRQGPVKVADQLPNGNAVTRFNSRLAMLITKGVGTMWCAYVFGIFDLLALPTAIKGGTYGIVQWVASFFLQLVLLSIIMVGQSIQGSASDARADQTFKDAEAILSECLELQKHLESQDDILAKLISDRHPASLQLSSNRRCHDYHVRFRHDLRSP
jgi:hypothetical protein